MNIRNKSKQVLDEGMAKRATFKPPVDSAPLRAYQYWLKSSEREPFRENFCHFWRVVVIWAPLHWLANTLLVPFFDSRPVRALGRGIAWVFTKPNKAWRNLDYDTRKKVQKVAEVSLITVVSLGILAFLVGAVIAAGFWNSLIAIGIVAGVMLVAFGIAVLLEKATAKSRARRKAERDRLLDLMITDYDEYLRQTRAPKNKSAFRKKVEAFFSAIGDYLILMGNVVRVNKWKICPTVEIPVEVDSAKTV